MFGRTSHRFNLIYMEPLKILQQDPWLAPYSQAIEGRHQYTLETKKALTGRKSLSGFADGYLYFGLHKTDQRMDFP